MVQPLPLRRRKAEFKFLDGFHGEMALLEVGHTGLPHLRAGEASMEIVSRQSRHFIKLLRHSRPRPLLRRHFFRRDFHMGIVRQLLYRFSEGNMIHFFQEAIHIAAGMAAETVVKSFLRGNRKRRCLLRSVERTGSEVVSSFLL